MNAISTIEGLSGAGAGAAWGANAADALSGPARPAPVKAADPKAAALFDDALASHAATPETDDGAASTPVFDNISLGVDRKGSQSGKLSPTQEFESFVLRNFVESMLPSKNTEFFGEGTAGNIWRSMLAERIGEQMARGGGIGIAKLLEDRHAAATSVDHARDGLAKDRIASIGAEAVRRK